MAKSKIKKQGIVVVVLGIAIVAGIVFLILTSSKVKKEVVVEAGSTTVDSTLFAKKESDQCTLVTQLTSEELSKIGTYDVVVKLNGKEYKSKVIVQDTTAPSCTIEEKEAWINEAIEASHFASDIKDVTTVTVSYVNEPDFSKEGTQDVEIVLEDEGNNKTNYKTKLTVKKDTEAPTFVGVSDIQVYIGETVSYKKNVTVEDNKDENLTFTVDNSKVNLSKAGTYEVTYTSKDTAGNEASKTIKVVVKEKPANYVDEATVNALADEVLNSILTDGMTDKQKIKAIYTYVRGHVSYRDGHDKPGYVIAAYNGLKKRQGDCYVYWATSKVLLTRANIKNMDIKKSDTTKSGHYWNLVDIGEGWYHFDTTPRKGGFDGFYLTDAALMKYSKAHSNSHIYDASLYPEIQ